MINAYRMFTLSNVISLLRAPLALLFIIENATLRTVIIFLAMFTDCVDGYLARRYKFTSRLGAILDPIMDKFFVFTALIVLLVEKTILPWQAASMISRDLFLFLFGIYIISVGKWRTFELKAIRWGKITTAMQFCTLIALVLSIPIPLPLYGLFVLFGLFALIELFIREFGSKNSC